MKSITIAIIACLFLSLLCSKADEVHTQYENVWANDNYKTMLLFDELSGRVMDMMVPKTSKPPFHFRDNGDLGHILDFQNWIHIDRSSASMIPGTTNSIHMHILGIEGGRRPKFFFDYSVSMIKSEFTGGSCFIWDINDWKDIPEELKKQKELFLYSRISNQVAGHYYKPISRGNSILLDKTLYNKLVAKMTKSNPEPFYAPKYINEGNRNYRKTRLNLARYDDGRLKTSAPDYAFEMLLDRSSGYLAVYIRYQNKDEPKDIDVSVIRKMIDPDELTAVVWDYWVRPGTEPGRRLKSEKAADLANKTQSKTQGDGDDTSFTIRVNQVYGTVRPIWELEIWAELGRRIQESKKPYILAFNDEDIKELKQPEISQTYLVVTQELYDAMEVLRKASDKTTRLEGERESLKGMLSQ